MFYRTGGRLRRLTLGTHPPLLLADARELAREALRSARLGSDPAANKKQERRRKPLPIWLGGTSNCTQSNVEDLAEDDRIITNKLNPAFGNVRAKDIKRAEVRLLVDTIAQRAPIEANRTLAVCRKMYNWAISKDLLETNPCTQISAPGEEHRRDRVLTEDEIRSIWKDLDSEEPRMAAIFRLRLMSAQRGGEVAAMERNEVDLAAGWWTIPGRNKKRTGAPGPADGPSAQDSRVPAPDDRRVELRFSGAAQQGEGSDVQI